MDARFILSIRYQAFAGCSYWAISNRKKRYLWSINKLGKEYHDHKIIRHQMISFYKRSWERLFEEANRQKRRGDND